MKAKQLIGIHRTVDLLNCISHYPEGLSFNTIQKKMDNLAAPTLSRLLKALCEANWLEKNDANIYCIGNGLKTLSSRIHGQQRDEEILEPIILELARLTRESSAYTTFFDNAFIIRLKSEQPSSFHYLPLYERDENLFTNGFGIVNLAHQADDIVQRNLRGHQYSQQQVTAIINRQRNIRTMRFLMSVETDIGTRFLAPVFYGQGGAYAGTIGVSSISQNINAERIELLTEIVRKTADRATNMLTSAL